LIKAQKIRSVALSGDATIPGYRVLSERITRDPRKYPVAICRRSRRRR